MGSRARRPLSSGVTNLMLACQQGRDTEVKSILSQKPFIGSNRDRYGRNAVHYCAENSSLSCAYQLLSLERRLVNVQDNDGYSPLHLAVISGNKVMARFLLRMGADINALDNENHSCVHWATVSADVESLEILLESEAKLSTPDIHGAYPVHYAAQKCGPKTPSSKGSPDVLRLLLQHGASVCCRDKDGRQPLLWAACSGNSDGVLSIISAGGIISAKDNDGLSALHYAASRGHTECLDVLINLCGASVDETDNSGCTALYYAVALGHADCTQLLLKYGADADHRDLRGRTPAHCAASKGHLEMMKILESHGANVWIRNLKGDLPLHEAVQSGRKDLVCWLLDQHGHSVNAPNIHGKTPLHVVAINNNVELCQVLLDRGACVNSLMKTSKSVLMTPMDAALSRRFRRCAKFLQSQGALPANRLLEKCELSRSLVNLLESAARPSSSEGIITPITNAEGGESLPSPINESVERKQHHDSGILVNLSQMDFWDLWESLTQYSQRVANTPNPESNSEENRAASRQLIVNNIYVYKENEKTRNHGQQDRLPTTDEVIGEKQHKATNISKDIARNRSLKEDSQEASNSFLDEEIDSGKSSEENEQMNKVHKKKRKGSKISGSLKQIIETRVIQHNISTVNEKDKSLSKSKSLEDGVSKKRTAVSRVEERRPKKVITALEDINSDAAYNSFDQKSRDDKSFIYHGKELDKHQKQLSNSLNKTKRVENVSQKTKDRNINKYNEEEESSDTLAADDTTVPSTELDNYSTAISHKKVTIKRISNKNNQKHKEGTVETSYPNDNTDTKQQLHRRRTLHKDLMKESDHFHNSDVILTEEGPSELIDSQARVQQHSVRKPTVKWLRKNTHSHKHLVKLKARSFSSDNVSISPSMEQTSDNTDATYLEYQIQERNYNERKRSQHHAKRIHTLSDSSIEESKSLPSIKQNPHKSLNHENSIAVLSERSTDDGTSSMDITLPDIHAHKHKKETMISSDASDQINLINDASQLSESTHSDEVLTVINAQEYISNERNDNLSPSSSESLSIILSASSDTEETINVFESYQQTHKIRNDKYQKSSSSELSSEYTSSDYCQDVNEDKTKSRYENGKLEKHKLVYSTRKVHNLKPSKNVEQTVPSSQRIHPSISNHNRYHSPSPSHSYRNSIVCMWKRAAAAALRLYKHKAGAFEDDEQFFPKAKYVLKKSKEISFQVDKTGRKNHLQYRDNPFIQNESVSESEFKRKEGDTNEFKREPIKLHETKFMAQSKDSKYKDVNPTDVLINNEHNAETLSPSRKQLRRKSNKYKHSRQKRTSDASVETMPSISTTSAEQFVNMNNQHSCNRKHINIEHDQYVLRQIPSTSSDMYSHFRTVPRKEIRKRNRHINSETTNVSKSNDIMIKCNKKNEEKQMTKETGIPAHVDDERQRTTKHEYQEEKRRYARPNEEDISTPLHQRKIQFTNKEILSNVPNIHQPSNQLLAEYKKDMELQTDTSMRNKNERRNRKKHSRLTTADRQKEIQTSGTITSQKALTNAEESNKTLLLGNTVSDSASSLETSLSTDDGIVINNENRIVKSLPNKTLNNTEMKMIKYKDDRVKLLQDEAKMCQLSNDGTNDRVETEKLIKPDVNISRHYEVLNKTSSINQDSNIINPDIKHQRNIKIKRIRNDLKLSNERIKEKMDLNNDRNYPHQSSQIPSKAMKTNVETKLFKELNRVDKNLKKQIKVTADGLHEDIKSSTTDIKEELDSVSKELKGEIKDVKLALTDEIVDNSIKYKNEVRTSYEQIKDLICNLKSNSDTFSKADGKVDAKVEEETSSTENKPDVMTAYESNENIGFDGDLSISEQGMKLGTKIRKNKNVETERFLVAENPISTELLVKQVSDEFKNKVMFDDRSRNKYLELSNSETNYTSNQEVETGDTTRKLENKMLSNLQEQTPHTVLQVQNMKVEEQTEESFKDGRQAIDDISFSTLKEEDSNNLECSLNDNKVISSVGICTEKIRPESASTEITQEKVDIANRPRTAETADIEKIYIVSALTKQMKETDDLKHDRIDYDKSNVKDMNNQLQFDNILISTSNQLYSNEEVSENSFSNSTMYTHMVEEKSPGDNNDTDESNNVHIVKSSVSINRFLENNFEIKDLSSSKKKQLLPGDLRMENTSANEEFKEEKSEIRLQNSFSQYNDLRDLEKNSIIQDNENVRDTEMSKLLESENVISSGEQKDNETCEETQESVAKVWTFGNKDTVNVYEAALFGPSSLTVNSPLLAKSENKNGDDTDSKIKDSTSISLCNNIQVQETTIPIIDDGETKSSINTETNESIFKQEIYSPNDETVKIEMNAHEDEHTKPEAIDSDRKKTYMFVDSLPISEVKDIKPEFTESETILEATEGKKHESKSNKDGEEEDYLSISPRFINGNKVISSDESEKGSSISMKYIDRECTLSSDISKRQCDERVGNNVSNENEQESGSNFHQIKILKGYSSSGNEQEVSSIVTSADRNITDSNLANFQSDIYIEDSNSIYDKNGTMEQEEKEEKTIDDKICIFNELHLDEGKLLTNGRKEIVCNDDKIGENIAIAHELIARESPLISLKQGLKETIDDENKTNTDELNSDSVNLIERLEQHEKAETEVTDNNSIRSNVDEETEVDLSKKAIYGNSHSSSETADDDSQNKLDYEETSKINLSTSNSESKEMSSNDSVQDSYSRKKSSFAVNRKINSASPTMTRNSKQYDNIHWNNEKVVRKSAPVGRIHDRLNRHEWTTRYVTNRNSLNTHSSLIEAVKNEITANGNLHSLDTTDSNEDTQQDDCNDENTSIIEATGTNKSNKSPIQEFNYGEIGSDGISSKKNIKFVSDDVIVAEIFQTEEITLIKSEIESSDSETLNEESGIESGSKEDGKLGLKEGDYFDRQGNIITEPKSIPMQRENSKENKNESISHRKINDDVYTEETCLSKEGRPASMERRKGKVSDTKQCSVPSSENPNRFLMINNNYSNLQKEIIQNNEKNIQSSETLNGTRFNSMESNESYQNKDNESSLEISGRLSADEQKLINFPDLIHDNAVNTNTDKELNRKTQMQDGYGEAKSGDHTIEYLPIDGISVFNLQDETVSQEKSDTLPGDNILNTNEVENKEIYSSQEQHKTILIKSEHENAQGSTFVNSATDLLTQTSNAQDGTSSNLTKNKNTERTSSNVNDNIAALKDVVLEKNTLKDVDKISTYNKGEISKTLSNGVSIASFQDKRNADGKITTDLHRSDLNISTENILKEKKLAQQVAYSGNAVTEENSSIEQMATEMSQTNKSAMDDKFDETIDATVKYVAFQPIPIGGDVSESTKSAKEQKELHKGDNTTPLEDIKKMHNCSNIFEKDSLSSKETEISNIHNIIQSNKTDSDIELTTGKHPRKEDYLEETNDVSSENNTKVSCRYLLNETNTCTELLKHPELQHNIDSEFSPESSDNVVSPKERKDDTIEKRDNESIIPGDDRNSAIPLNEMEDESENKKIKLLKTAPSEIAEQEIGNKEMVNQECISNKFIYTKNQIIRENNDEVDRLQGYTAPGNNDLPENIVTIEKTKGESEETIKEECHHLKLHNNNINEENPAVFVVEKNDTEEMKSGSLPSINASQETKLMIQPEVQNNYSNDNIKEQVSSMKEESNFEKFSDNTFDIITVNNDDINDVTQKTIEIAQDESRPVSSELTTEKKDLMNSSENKILQDLSTKEVSRTNKMKLHPENSSCMSINEKKLKVLDEFDLSSIDDSKDHVPDKNVHISEKAIQTDVNETGLSQMKIREVDENRYHENIVKISAIDAENDETCNSASPNTGKFKNVGIHRRKEYDHTITHVFSDGAAKSPAEEQILYERTSEESTQLKTTEKANVSKVDENTDNENVINENASLVVMTVNDNGSKMAEDENKPLIPSELSEKFEQEYEAQGYEKIAETMNENFVEQEQSEELKEKLNNDNLDKKHFEIKNAENNVNSEQEEGKRDTNSTVKETSFLNSVLNPSQNIEKHEMKKYPESIVSISHDDEQKMESNTKKGMNEVARNFSENTNLMDVKNDDVQSTDEKNISESLDFRNEKDISLDNIQGSVLGIPSQIKHTSTDTTTSLKHTDVPTALIASSNDKNIQVEDITPLPSTAVIIKETVPELLRLVASCEMANQEDKKLNSEDDVHEGTGPQAFVKNKHSFKYDSKTSRDSLISSSQLVQQQQKTINLGNDFETVSCRNANDENTEDINYGSPLNQLYIRTTKDQSSQTPKTTQKMDGKNVSQEQPNGRLEHEPEKNIIFQHNVDGFIANKQDSKHEAPLLFSSSYAQTTDMESKTNSWPNLRQKSASPIKTTSSSTQTFETEEAYVPKIFDSTDGATALRTKESDTHVEQKKHLSENSDAINSKRSSAYSERNQLPMGVTCGSGTQTSPTEVIPSDEQRVQHSDEAVNEGQTTEVTTSLGEIESCDRKYENVIEGGGVKDIGSEISKQTSDSTNDAAMVNIGPEDQPEDKSVISEPEMVEVLPEGRPELERPANIVSEQESPSKDEKLWNGTADESMLTPEANKKVEISSVTSEDKQLPVTLERTILAENNKRPSRRLRETKIQEADSVPTTLPPSSINKVDRRKLGKKPEIDVKLEAIPAKKTAQPVPKKSVKKAVNKFLSSKDGDASEKATKEPSASSHPAENALKQRKQDDDTNGADLKAFSNKKDSAKNFDDGTSLTSCNRCGASLSKEDAPKKLEKSSHGKEKVDSLKRLSNRNGALRSTGTSKNCEKNEKGRKSVAVQVYPISTKFRAKVVNYPSLPYSATQVGPQQGRCICQGKGQRSLCCLQKELLKSHARLNAARFQRGLSTIPEMSGDEGVKRVRRSTSSVLPSLPVPNSTPRLSGHERRVNSIIEQIRSLTSPISFLVTVQGASSKSRPLSVSISPADRFKSKSTSDVSEKRGHTSSSTTFSSAMKKGVSLPDFTKRVKFAPDKGRNFESAKVSPKPQMERSQKPSEGKFVHYRQKTQPQRLLPKRSTILRPQATRQRSVNASEKDEKVAFHVEHGKERDVFVLPTEPLEEKQKWEVTFTIKKDGNAKDTTKK